MANATITSSAVDYQYDIRSYKSNVEIFVTVLGDDGEMISSGRCASLDCTGDSPHWEKESDWGDDDSAMTDGYSLGIFLGCLTGEDLREWLSYNNEGDGISHL